jgi:hypothetical protein
MQMAENEKAKAQAAVGNRRRPIDNRPQINNLPHSKDENAGRATYSYGRDVIDVFSRLPAPYSSESVTLPAAPL